jgi:hypothetical protein
MLFIFKGLYIALSIAKLTKEVFGILQLEIR